MLRGRRLASWQWFPVLALVTTAVQTAVQRDAMARAATVPAVHVDIGSALGGPGDTVDITVTLAAAGVSVAATGNDITYNKSALSLDPSTCHVTPGIGKSLLANLLGENRTTKTVRVFVQAEPSTNPIPGGPLYTCTFQIAPTALPASYKLVNDNTVAFDPVGAKLAGVSGVDGVVAVSLVIIPTATPTPIPTSTPSAIPTSTSSATASATPTDTPTPTPTINRCPHDLMLVPSAAPAGSAIHVSGSCMVPHALQAEVFFDAGSVAMLSIRTSGTYEANFSVPLSALPGTHRVSVVASNEIAAGTFEVTPECLGDCDGNHIVTVDEILTGINVALGNGTVASCAASDGNQDEQITIDEVLAAVNAALAGCAISAETRGEGVSPNSL